jgi:hypothetical protein
MTIGIPPRFAIGANGGQAGAAPTLTEDQTMLEDCREH